MKKIFFYLFALSVLSSACKKDTSPFLDDPDKRLIETLEKYQTLLMGAPNGWTATLFPNGGQGFNYYFDFKTKNSVTMFSDFDTSKAVKEGKGSWLLKALQQPTLIFDTYSYIHAPADPNDAISGGTRGTGLQSDFEFAFTKTGDTITLKGIYNGSKMIMVKTSQADAAKIKAGGLKEMMKKSDAFFKSSAYKYLQFADGRKVEFSFDKKNVLLTWANDAGEVTTLSTPFCFQLDRLTLKDSLSYNGQSFMEVLWDDTSKQYYIAIGGTRYNVQSSQTPIIPLHFRFGFGREFSNITVNPVSLTGLPQSFMNVYNATVSGLNGYGSRKLNYFMMIFTGPNELTLRLNYTNTAGTVFNANFIHNIDWKAANRTKFTFVSRDNNGNAIATYVTALTNYIIQNEFLIDWSANLTPGSSSLLGGFYKADDPSNYFFGPLGK
jgi:hypothetical protein